MSLLRDIQAEAMSRNADVPTLLRMCKVLAARLKNKPFGDWVDYELIGYPNIAALPPYRIIAVPSFGSFVGSFNQAQRLAIPISILPQPIQDRYRYAHLTFGVSAYTTLVHDNGNGVATEQWPMEIAVHYATLAMKDMQCISAWKEIPTGAFAMLIDSIKTRVLGFAIGIEQEAPDAGESPINIPPMRQEKVTQIFNTNIYGSVGNLTNGGSDFSQVSTMSVTAGDWSTLQSYLKTIGLTDADMDALKKAIDSAKDLAPAQALDGPLSGWIGKLATKVSKRVAGISVEIATVSIAKAIAAYLGL